MGYFKNSAVAFDCWANTWRGGLPGITISSDAARARDRGEKWGITLCACLDAIDPCHCDKALLGDMARSADVAAYLASNPGATVKEVLKAVPTIPVTTTAVHDVLVAVPAFPLSANSDATVREVYSRLWRESLERGK